MSAHPFPSLRPDDRPPPSRGETGRPLSSLGERQAERREVESFLRRLFATTPNAWVTRWLLVANVSVFLAMVLSGVAIAMPDLPDLWSWGGLYGPLVAEGEYWRLITATFVHAGIIHLAFNMWVLWQAGPLVERLYGNRAYLILYLTAGLGGTVASFLTGPDITSVGASGAIFGIIGALLAYLSRTRDEMPAALWRSLRRGGLLFVGLNVALGFAIPRIDNAGHLGGLVAGFVVGYVLVRPIGRPSRHTWAARAKALGIAGLLVALAAWGVRNLEFSGTREDEMLTQATEIYLRAGQFDEAVEQSVGILRHRPGSATARIEAARALAAVGRLDDAREVLAPLRDLEPTRDELRRGAAVAEFLSGHELLAAGLTDGALEHFQIASERDPTFAPAHVWRAQILADRGMDEGALAALRAAKAQWPGYDLRR